MLLDLKSPGKSVKNVKNNQVHESINEVYESYFLSKDKMNIVIYQW